MQQQKIDIYPFYKDSWTIYNSKIAEKHVDRSIFMYGQTRLPKEVAAFLGSADLKHGYSKEIKLSHSNKLYIGEISTDTVGRTKLSWGKELRDVINAKLIYSSKFFIEEDCATDEMMNRPYIKFIKVSDILYKIELLFK